MHSSGYSFKNLNQETPLQSGVFCDFNIVVSLLVAVPWETLVNTLDLVVPQKL